MKASLANNDHNLVQPVHLFSRQRFVLVQPTHPGNIGAAARAIKTMGFSRLILVQPLQQKIHCNPIATAMASGADDILKQAEIVDSLDQALIGTSLTIALSARIRELAPPLFTPRAAAQYTNWVLNQHPENQIAWIFGNERYGLPNHIVERCQLLVNIPANPDYSSLNLAQAVQLLAYEARIALQATEDIKKHFASEKSIKRANSEEIEAMFTHFEQALIALKFLDPYQPKKLMSRLRRLFSRSYLEIEEINIFRGIARAILQSSNKH